MALASSPPAPRGPRASPSSGPAGARAGQGSVEYLVVFAAVMVVALVLMALLAFYPGASSGNRAAQSEAYWQAAYPFSILNTKQTSGGAAQTLSLEVQNHGPNPLILKNISLVARYSSLTAWASPSVKFMAAGSAVNLSVVNGTNGLLPSCASAGSWVEYTVAFQFDDDPLLNKTQLGTQPLVVLCS